MFQKPFATLYRLRFLWASFAVILTLVLTSAIVTAAAANTSLNPKKPSTPAPARQIGEPNSINAVTAGGSEMMAVIANGSIKAGTSLYRACAAVTKASSHTGSTIKRGSVVTASAISHRVVYMGRSTTSKAALAGHAVGDVITPIVRLPGKAISSIYSTKAVGNLVRPAEAVQSETPVIDSQTSSELLAQYDQEQRQRLEKLLTDQKDENAHLDGTIVAGDPAHGGYPAVWDNARQDSMVDTWGMYNRECVSYTAWKVYQTFGNMPYWGGVGNANQWVADAIDADIPTSNIPRVHSVAISMRGHYGHAMWVEKVAGDLIYVSQYNLNLDGRYSEMWVDSSSFTYLYF